MVNNGQSIWHDLAVFERLKKLVSDPAAYSANDIAGMLGVSRNAVIGKVHRSGLQFKRPSTRQMTPGKIRDRRAASERRRARRAGEPRKAIIFGNRFQPGSLAAEPLPKELPADTIPIGQRKTLMELRACHCRFIYGNPRDPSHFYCGDSVVNESSYCAFHWRVTRTVAPVISQDERDRRSRQARKNLDRKARAAA